jgi:hypothetical protein
MWINRSLVSRKLEQKLSIRKILDVVCAMAFKAEREISNLIFLKAI